MEQFGYFTLCTCKTMPHYYFVNLSLFIVMCMSMLKANVALAVLVGVIMSCITKLVVAAFPMCRRDGRRGT